MIHDRFRWAKSIAVVLLMMLPASAVGAQSLWAEAPANLTVRELLGLYFKMEMGRGESEWINSFNLVSFCPSSNRNQGIIFVIQTYHDEIASAADLRKAIRDVSVALYELFKSHSQLPIVRNRWSITNPEECFIIRHVRYADIAETLAVTVGGNTYFEPGRFQSVKEYVEWFGGVWIQ